MIDFLSKLLEMRNPEDVEKQTGARKLAEDTLVRANAELAHRVEELRASEERFRLLVDGTKDHAIFMVDPDGRVASWNPGAERINQYTAEEIIGQHFSRFYPEGDKEAGKPGRNLQLTLAEGRYEEEGWRLRKDGSRFWASVVITALRDEAGRPRGFSMVTRDITHKMQAEEDVRRLLQEETARRAAENLAEILQLVHKIDKIGHWEWDSLTDTNKWSPEIEALYGLRSGEFEGTYQAWAKLVHPDDLAQAEEDVRRAMETGQYFTEFRVVWPDGSVHWLETRAYVFKDGHDKPTRIAGVNMDITERKLQEEALREADRRKDEFLATLAHELRNPLAPICNGLQILCLTDEPAAAERARQMMERQLGQLVRLVDDLLDISRISRNRLELRKARIPLTSVLDNAIETARPLIDTKGHTLTVNLPQEAIFLDADLTRLAQVFWNLLNNSAKYTDPGGRIDLSARRDGAWIEVSVRDNGIGIPAEAIPGLFTLFSQVTPSLERSQGGLGIGLALLKGLVEMHGGTVCVSSPGIGAGTDVVVRLPLARISADEPAQPTSPRITHSPCRRILIVDDNRDAAASLGTMLALAGHDTRAAHDGLEALELAEAFRPDVVLLDIGLPKLNGFDACRRIRGQPWGKDIVIVAVTGWGQPDDRRRSREAGFDQHMVKPVDPRALMKWLDGWGKV